MLKNRSNIAASILSSPEILEDAYKQSTQAKGFGDTELGYYMDSLEARITKLQNRISEFATLTIDSQWLKDMVGLLTVAMEHVNGLSKAFGGLSVAAGAIGGFFLQQNGFGLLQYNKTTKKTSWGKFITSIQNRNTPQELSPELQNYFSQYDSNQQIEGANLNWQVAPEEFKKYVQSMNEAGKELGTFGDAQQAVTTRTTLLSGALKKGTNIAKLFGSTLISMGVSMLASFAVGKIIEGIRWLFTYHQRTIKAGEEAKNRIKEQTNAYDEQAKAINELGKSLSGQKEDYKSNADAIDVISKKYSELKEGVNSITNENISLSDEQYQQYLDTCNQLAEQFPSLVSGYDSQKNAILDLGGAADTVTQQLQTLFAAQQLSANMKIAEDLGILFDGVVEKTKELDGQIKELETQEQVYETYNALPTISEEGIITVGRNKADRITQYLSNSPDYKDWLEIRSDFGDNGQIFLDYSGDISKLKDEERQALQEELMGLFDLSDYEISQTEQQKQALQMMIEDQWASITSGLGEYLKKAPTFTKLNDDIQAAILANLDNIDLSKAKDYKDFTTFLYTEVLQPLKNLDDEAQKNLSDALQLSADNIPMGDYYDQVKEKLLAAANNDKTKADDWFYQFFSRQFTEDFKNRSILAQAMSKHMKDESGTLPEEAFGWMLGLDRDDLQHAVELFKGQVYTELSELQEDVENYGKNNIKPINDGTLAELLGKEDYKSGAENFEKALSSLTGSLQTLRENGQLTSEELVNLINTFPQLKDVTGDGIDANDIGNAAFGQLNQWIGLIRKNMDGLSKDQKAMAETLIQQMQFQYGDLGLQENQVRQQIHKSVGQIAGLSMYQQFAQAGIVTDALEKAGAFTEDNLQITASFIADPANLEGPVEEVATRWDNYQMLWHIYVDDDEIENEIARLTSQRELNKAESDYRVSLGIKMTAQDYRDDNTLSNQLIEQYEAQIEDATNKINESPLDEELARTQREKINEAQRNIFAERATQAENNKTIRELMLEPYEQTLNEIEHEMQKTANRRTEKEFAGETDFTEENNADIESLTKSNSALTSEINILKLQSGFLKLRSKLQKENYETNSEYIDLQTQIADKEQTRFENDQKMDELRRQNENTERDRLQNRAALLSTLTGQQERKISDWESKGKTVTKGMYQDAIAVASLELDNITKAQEEAMSRLNNFQDSFEKVNGNKDWKDNTVWQGLITELDKLMQDGEGVENQILAWQDAIDSITFNSLSMEMNGLKRTEEELQRELDNPKGGDHADTYLSLMGINQQEQQNIIDRIAEEEANFNNKTGRYEFTEGDQAIEDHRAALAELAAELHSTQQAQEEFKQSFLMIPVNNAIRALDKYKDELQDLQDKRGLSETLGIEATAQDYEDEKTINRQIQARSRAVNTVASALDKVLEFAGYEETSGFRTQLKDIMTSATSDLRGAIGDEFMAQKAQDELTLNALTKEADKYQRAATELNDNISLLEAQGQAVSAKNYRGLIDNADMQIANYEQVAQEYWNLMNMDEYKGTTYWAEYAQGYTDTLSSINSLKISQIEWNEAIRQIPIDNISNKISELQEEATVMQDTMSFDETRGMRVTLRNYNKLLANSKKQVKLYQQQNKLLKEQQKGMDVTNSKYKTIQDQINQNNQAIRQAAQSQYEWGRTIALGQVESMMDAIKKSQTAMTQGHLDSAGLLEFINGNREFASVLSSTTTGVYVDAQKLSKLAQEQGELAIEVADAQKAAEFGVYQKNERAMMELAQQAGLTVDSIDELYAAIAKDPQNPDFNKIFDLKQANENILSNIDTLQSYKEELLQVTSALGRYQLAQSTANWSDPMQTIRGGMEGAKKLWDQGWVGRDDFTTFADLIATNAQLGTDAAITSFKENYDAVQKYLTENTQGVHKWYDDMKSKMPEIFDVDENGKEVFNIENMEEFANQMGRSTAFAEYMLMAMKDAGYNVDLSRISDSFSESFSKISGEEANAGQLVRNLVDDMKEAASNGRDVTRAAEGAANALQRMKEAGASDDIITGFVEELNRDLGELNGFYIDPKTLEITTKVDTVELEETEDKIDKPHEIYIKLKSEVDAEESKSAYNAIQRYYQGNQENLKYDMRQSGLANYGIEELSQIDFKNWVYDEGELGEAEKAMEQFAVQIGYVGSASELTNEKAQALIVQLAELTDFEIEMGVNSDELDSAEDKLSTLKKIAQNPIVQKIKTSFETLGGKVKEKISDKLEEQKVTQKIEMENKPVTDELVNVNTTLGTVNSTLETGFSNVVSAINGENSGSGTASTLSTEPPTQPSFVVGGHVDVDFDGSETTSVVKMVPETSEFESAKADIESNPTTNEVVMVPGDTSGVSKSLSGVDGQSASVTVTADTTGVEAGTESLKSFKEMAESISGTDLFNFSTNTTEINEAIDESREKAEEFAEGDYTAELNGEDNISSVVETAQGNVDMLHGKTVTVDAEVNGFDNVIKLNSAINRLPSYTKSRVDVEIITTEIKQTEIRGSAPAGGSGNTPGVSWTGTAITSHADGTAKDWTVGRDETAIVNEIGQEAYIHDGVYRKIPGGVQLHHFDKDDIIFNAEQVKQLEKYGRVKSGKKFGIQAHSKGTVNELHAYVNSSGSGGATDLSDLSRRNVGYTGDSGSAEQVAAAAGAAGDAIEDFKTWLGKLFDWIEVRIERLQSRIALAQAKSENRIGYGKKNADLWEAMEVIRKNLMPDTTAGEARYRQQADTVRSKAIESGLVDEATANDLINKIKLGTIDIQELEENPKQFVDAYKTWFDKAEQLKAQQEELISQVKELEQTRLSNITEQYETLIGLAEEYNSTAEEAANLAIAGTLTDKTTRKAMDLYGQSVARQDAQITPQIAKEIKAYEQELAIAAQIFGTASNEYRSAQTELQAMKTQWIESMNAATETYSKMLDLVSQRAEEQMDLYDKAYAKSSAAQGVAGTGMTGVEKAIEFMGDGTGLSKNKNTYQNQNAMLDLQSKHTEKVMKLREQAVKDLQAEEAKAAANYQKAMKDSSKSDEERTTMQNRLTLAVKARQEAQKAAAEAEAEYASTLVKNEQEKFSNIENYYETRLAYQQSINKLNEGVETLTNYGNPNGVPDENENMKVMEHRWLTNLGGNNAELKELRSEYSALTNELNRSDLVKGSDEWMELQTRINGVRSSIYDLREENLKLYEEWMNAPTQKAEDKIQKLANDFANVNAAASGISSGGSGIAAALNNISGSISNGTAKVSANKNTYQNQNIIADAQLNQIKQTMKTRQEAEKLAKNNYTVAMANYNKAKKNGASGEDINDFYQKMIIAQNALTTATNNSAQAEGEYIAALVKTEQTKFDNVMKYYDSRIKYQQASNDLAEKELELRNYTSEWMSDQQYKTGLNNNLGDLDSYNEELVKLEQQLNSGVNSGVIKKDSEEWKELREKIFGVEQQIKNTREENLKLFEEWSKSPILKADDKIEKLNASFEDMHAAEDAAASGLAGIRAAIDNISGNTRLNANAATWVNQNALLNYDLAETKKTMEYRQGAEKDTLAIYEEQRKEYEKMQKNFNNTKGKLSAEQYQKALSKVRDQQQKMLIAQNNWRDAQKSASEAEGKYAADLIANEQKKFENIVKYYETILNYQKSINSVREKDLDLSNRSAGYMTNSQYSQNVADNSAELKILNAELLRLQNQINNSPLDHDTDEWKELQTQLNNTIGSVQNLREENLSLWESFAKAPIDKAAKDVGKLAQVMNRLKGIYQTISTGISGRQAYAQTLNTVGNKRLAALDNYKMANNYQNTATKNLEATINNLQRGRLMGFVQDAINSGKPVNTNSAEFKSLPSSTQAKIKAYNAALSTRNKANASRSAAYKTYNEYNEMYKALNSGNYASIFKKNSGNPVYTIQNALLDEQLKNQKESIADYEDAIKKTADNVRTAISAENQAQSKLVNQTMKLLGENRDKFNKDVIDKINAGKKISPEDIANITNASVISAVNNYNTAVDNATDAATNYETALDAQATAAQNYAEAVENTAQMVVSNEKEKFSNVKSYFDNELAYRRALADEVKKGVDLRRAHGYWETQDDFTKQIDEARKELKILQDERKSLQDQLNASVASGAIKKGSEEWKELQTQIEGVDSSILDTKANIENLTQETLRVKYDELFERASQQADRYIDRLQTINGLLNDEMFFTDKGELTAFGALALQEDAKQLDYNIANLKRYIKERQEIMDDYNNGTYGMEKYLELLDANQSNINQYLNAANSNRQDILKIIKDQAQEELNAINKTIEARREALSRKKECKKQCSYLSNCWNTLRGLLTTTQG